MKKPKSKPPLSVPRLGSLLPRLQNAPETDDQTQPFLDQLMIFLGDPPTDVRDRWKEGAKMCAEWGIPCTGASVWRLYRLYALEWRLRLAQEVDLATVDSPEVLEQRATQLLAARTFEALANPHTSLSDLLGLARIELRKRTLDFAVMKHAHGLEEKEQTHRQAMKDAVVNKQQSQEFRERLMAAISPDVFQSKLSALNSGLNPAQPSS